MGKATYMANRSTSCPNSFPWGCFMRADMRHLTSTAQSSSRAAVSRRVGSCASRSVSSSTNRSQYSSCCRPILGASPFAFSSLPLPIGEAMVNKVLEKSAMRPGRNVAGGRSARGTKPGCPSSFFAFLAMWRHRLARSGCVCNSRANLPSDMACQSPSPTIGSICARTCSDSRLWKAWMVNSRCTTRSTGFSFCFCRSVTTRLKNPATASGRDEKQAHAETFSRNFSLMMSMILITCAVLAVSASKLGQR
mmetsp:Transcript_6222/g.17865  ORF Transcript_6222/g.17865 Transcript_6222/m.17865 type:complete len:250 (+) Transcript_6222:3340-4089(+)